MTDTYISPSGKKEEKEFEQWKITKVSPSEVSGREAGT